jgi:uncharacterized protein (TIGR02996 family)
VSQADIAALFAQVWATPDDDAVRLVLADALLSIGDPRGELIQLQCHPQRAPATRVMRLIQAHGLTWLGRLRGAVLPVGYERGFLASCVVASDTGVIGADEWSTVHTVELQIAGAELLAHPVMRSLRRISQLEPPALRHLLDHAPAATIARLDSLGVARPWSSLPALCAQLVRLPALRSVELVDPRRTWLRRGADDRLSVMEVEYDPLLLDVLPRLPADQLTHLVVDDIPDDQLDLVRDRAAAQHRLVTLDLRPHAPVYDY